MSNKSVKLTEDQKNVLDSKNENLLVSAAAGSGKTFVMMEKIKDMIINKDCSVLEILVVTFTKAAASEMKAKLISKLEDKSDDPYIKEQLNEISVSNISTLHSFCARLLKTYFYEIGLDPSFIMIDEVESKVLKEKAIAKLINKSFEDGNTDFLELLDIFSLNRKDDNLKNIVYKFYDYLQNLVNPKEWHNTVLEMNYDADLEQNIAYMYVNNILIAESKEFLSEAYKLVDICTNSDCPKLVNFLNNHISVLKLLSSVENLSYKVKVLKESSLTKETDIKVDDEFLELKNNVNSLTKSIYTFVYKFKNNLVVDNSSDQEKQARLIKTKNRVDNLYKFVQKFSDTYTEMKKEKVALDFNDLEHYTLQLLNIVEVKKSIQEKFKYVFVDEYQDTNIIQEEIITKIAKENNLFMVGDVKQSIYKFRESEPEIFVNKYNKYKIKNNSHNKVINLNDNFRSHQDILEFVNIIFDDVMTEEFGNVNYKRDARLRRGGSPQPNFLNSNVVEIEIIEKQKNKKEEIVEKLPVYSVQNHINYHTETTKSAEKEGEILVEKIKNLLTQNIYCGTENDIHKFRKINYNDICVLTASRGEYLRQILKKMDEARLPYSTDIKDDIFDNSALNELLNLLKIIDNFNQDIPLISVMQSSLFNFSVDDLAEIKLKNNEVKFFYEAILESLSKKNIKENIYNKLQCFVRYIDKCRFESNFKKVNELLVSITKDFNYEISILSSEDGERALQNFNKLLAYLNGKSFNDNLSKFIESLKENKIEFTCDSSDEGVLFTTIHKSKGLEYPVVILIGAGRDLTSSNKDTLQISRKFGVSVDYYDRQLRTKSKSVNSFAINLENNYSSIEEKARLLYVALTRAMNKLIVIGVKPENKCIKPKYAKCFYDWILPAVEKVQFQQNNQLYQDNNTLKIDVHKHALQLNLDQLNNSKNHRIKVSDIDQELLKEIKNVFNFEYPYERYTNMLAKTTVSEMLKTPETETFTKPMFNITDGETAIKKGVAYHKFLQNIDLVNILNCKEPYTKNDFDKNLEDLVLQNKLEKEEVKLINSDDLIYLLNNSDFRSLKNAKIFREQEFLTLANINKMGGIELNSDSDSVMIQGIVDFVALKGDKIIIIDYKTNNYNNEMKFIETYKKQLSIYESAMKNYFNIKKSESYIYSFKLRKFIKMN